MIAGTVASSELEYHKVRLMDHDTKGAGTWLFRTNLPVINGTFAYDTLLQYMQSRAAENNVSFPETGAKVKLVDISFLNIKEYEDLRVEEDFFAANPDKGEFQNWPIVGSLISPNWLSEEERRKEVAGLNNSIDDLPKRIPLLHDWIHPIEEPTLPLIVFFHCEAGSDRTGAIAGSYAMSYLGKNLQEVYAWDTEVAGRPIASNLLFGMMFFCWWLTYIQGFTTLGCE